MMHSYAPLSVAIGLLLSFNAGASLPETCMHISDDTPPWDLLKTLRFNEIKGGAFHAPVSSQLRIPSRTHSHAKTLVFSITSSTG
jgi:hypothetical protein